VLQAKLYYLKQLKDGPQSHRTITKRMSGKFADSAAGIKNALVAEGLIVCVKKVLMNNGKYAYYFKRTEKPVVLQEPPTYVPTWEDGTAKSTGNAFDWRNKEQRIFTKAQIAQMQQKQVGNSFPITTYSRA
jgi:hypothetical protein